MKNKFINTILIISAISIMFSGCSENKSASTTISNSNTSNISAKNNKTNNISNTQQNTNVKVASPVIVSYDENPYIQVIKSNIIKGYNSPNNMTLSYDVKILSNTNIEYFTVVTNSYDNNGNCVSIAQSDSISLNPQDCVQDKVVTFTPNTVSKYKGNINTRTIVSRVTYKDTNNKVQVWINPNVNTWMAKYGKSYQ